MGEATPFIVMGIDQAQGSDDPARSRGHATFDWVNVAREKTYEESIADMEMAMRREILALWRAWKESRA